MILYEGKVVFEYNSHFYDKEKTTNSRIIQKSF